MKILVVHEVSYKKKPVYEYQDFAERLADRGHEVTVIDFDETGNGSDKAGFITKTGLAQIKHRPIQHVNIPFINILHARHVYKKTIIRALKNKSFDIALVYSVFVNGSSTVKIFKRYNVPVIYRVLDIYHKLRKNPLLQLPLLMGEKYIYRNSNLILTTNRILSEYVDQLRKKTDGPQVKVLGHGVDCDHFRPTPKSTKLMEKLGIEQDSKIILFLGTTYNFSGIDVILKYLPRLENRLGNVKFIVVGAGELDEKLKAISRELKQVDNLIQMGMQPYENLPEILGLADILVNPFKINEITKSIIPIKMLQYLASGKPCISAPIKDVMNLMPTHLSGVRFCDIENSESFIAEIEKILSLSPSESSEIGEKGRRFAINNLSISKQIDLLESYFREMIEASKLS